MQYPFLTLLLLCSSAFLKAIVNAARKGHFEYLGDAMNEDSFKSRIKINPFRITRFLLHFTIVSCIALNYDYIGFFINENQSLFNQLEGKVIDYINKSLNTIKTINENAFGSFGMNFIFLYLIFNTVYKYWFKFFVKDNAEWMKIWNK